MFYAFYNKELAIDDSDMSAALQDCYQLLRIADYLGCTALISKPIEIALLKHGQDLFRAIQKKPHAWIEMSYRVRSELIFRECMVHLVGNWKSLKSSRSTLDYLREVPGVRGLIEKYHRAMLNQCKALELAVMSHYPGNISTPVEDLPIKREAFAKDILVWMALTFFRHWVGQRLIMERGRNSADCGYELYKQIGTAGDSYMDKSVINQFHTKFPMTKKAMNVLENHLLEIKECMKEIVDEHKILKSYCQLDVHRFPVEYLTCIELKKEDYPWDNETEGPRVLPAKRAYKPGGNDIARRNLDSARMNQERSLSMEKEKDEGDEGEFESDEEDLEDIRGKRARIQ
jgi:hypothetical protein